MFRTQSLAQEGLQGYFKNLIKTTQADLVRDNIKKIVPSEFIANGQSYEFKMDDPIFKLSEPVDRAFKTQECLYCREQFKSDKYRRWCDFCGHNMCQKCTRIR